MARRFATMLPILAALGGCGGGGNGVETAASTPPPAPNYTALANATASTTLAAQAVRTDFVRLDNAPVPTVTGQSASIEISYDAASRVYQVRGAPMPGSTATITQSFGPADASASIPGTYERISTTNGRTEVARLTTGPSTGFTYASYGAWTTGVTEASGDQRFGTLYFSYGIRTQAADMPKTGSASYALQLSGDAGGGGTPVSGTGGITANFAAGTIGASLAPTYIYGPNRISNFANLSGTGTIDSANSAFAATVAGDGYSGSLGGIFYGPQAAEVGGSFVLTAPNGGVAAVGALLGRRN